MRSNENLSTLLPWARTYVSVVLKEAVRVQNTVALIIVLAENALAVSPSFGVFMLVGRMPA